MRVAAKGGRSGANEVSSAELAGTLEFLTRRLCVWVKP